MGLEIPTVAFVHGSTLGGGLELALACDFLVAADSARLGLPEINLGVFPPIAAALLPEEIGRRHATELILTGDTVSAREGFEMGLVHRIGGEEEAVAILERFVDRPAPALAACKRALRRTASARIAAAERIYLEELMVHPEPVEGLRAFLEKRKPAWAGRSE